ncbi:TetR/AcrR family transcriptional regulator [Actinomycetota bacterium Odt1-20B]
MPTTPESERRPHTGRRRNEAARQAILAAARRLLAENAPGRPVTVDAIAREAGIGKQTIYRWWPSKGAVLLEALTSVARDEVRTPDTGALESDLAAFLGDIFRAGTAPDNAALLRNLATEAARDAQVAELLLGFTRTRRADLRTLLERAGERGEVAPGTDLDLLVDQAFGVYWFRFLSGLAPLTPAVARELARTLARGAR